MNKDLINSKSNDWFMSQSKAFESKLNGNDNSLFKSIRNDSLKQLSVTAFPTLKTEEWKYTNIKHLLGSKFKHASNLENQSFSKDDIKEVRSEGFEHHLLVFVNGIFSNELSEISELPQNVFVGNLCDGIKQENQRVSENLNKIIKSKSAFDHLNSSYLYDGACIIIPDSVVLGKPIQVLNISGYKNELTFNTPRNLIYAGENSQASVVFKFVSLTNSKYFTNTSTEVFVAKNAIVDLYKIELENENSYHIDRTEVYQKANSVFSHFNFSIGGALVRNDINSKLDDENIECNFYGLSIGSGDQHIDNHTYIDHAKPNCESNELYKSILDDKAHGVFSGKILVDKDAQKTNAYQSNKTVLLSEEASIDTKPQLEIYADDVKCSHGATVGHLDETALFYILSRGIPENKAKSMLITAFAEDVISKIKINSLKEKMNHLIFDHLHREKI